MAIAIVMVIARNRQEEPKPPASPRPTKKRTGLNRGQSSKFRGSGQNSRPE